MATVSFREVSKSYGDVPVIESLNLAIEDQEFMVLVGPSGCGKSTALRMIAGLEDVSSGEIAIGERVVNEVPPKDRDIAMVFQNYALYPHMTIRENLEFGLRMRHTPRDDRDRLVSEASEMLGLAEVLERRPAQLSGGQRQRVAFARALGVDPPILLMDEPFGAVDRITRERLQQEFIRIQRSMRKTIVFVTHDIDEAVMVGDRICLLEMQAKIAQYDTPEAILTRPASDYVSEFLGRERLVRRMSVKQIDVSTLVHPASGPTAGEPHVVLTSTLSEAFAAALTSPTERAAVFDGERYVGAFTATSLLESLRRASDAGGGEVAAGI